ncbi:cell envelope integrity protein TolA, partial [Acinetobacter guillouiae]
KAKADAAAKAKADADAKRKADLARELDEEKASAAEKAKEAAANKKAEARKVASSAKKDFESKVRNAWRMPAGSTGQKATARVTLTDSGSVASIIVNASDPDVKASVEQAVRNAAPFPMPSDPDARREARSFSANFTVK